jgi:hypothetical protein
MFSRTTDDHFAAAARLAELLAENDRDRSAFGMDMFVDFDDGPDAWHELCKRWEQAGGSLMSLRSLTLGSAVPAVAAAPPPGPDQHIAALEEFSREMR